MNDMSKDIRTLNDKGKAHGLWVRYWYGRKLMFKRFFHNGKKVGYSEWYSISGKLTKKKYHL